MCQEKYGDVAYFRFEYLGHFWLENKRGQGAWRLTTYPKLWVMGHWIKFLIQLLYLEIVFL